MLVDLGEGGEQPLAALAVERLDALAQLGDRGGRGRRARRSAPRAAPRPRAPPASATRLTGPILSRSRISRSNAVRRIGERGSASAGVDAGRGEDRVGRAIEPLGDERGDRALGVSRLVALRPRSARAPRARRRARHRRPWRRARRRRAASRRQRAHRAASLRRAVEARDGSASARAALRSRPGGAQARRSRASSASRRSSSVRALARRRFGAAAPRVQLVLDRGEALAPQLRLAHQPVVLALAGEMVERAARRGAGANAAIAVARQRRVGQRGQRWRGALLPRFALRRDRRRAARPRRSSASSREAIGGGLARQLGCRGRAPSASAPSALAHRLARGALGIGWRRVAALRCGEARRAARSRRRARAPHPRARRGGCAGAGAAPPRSACRRARRNPSQRHKPPSRLTSRWPGAAPPAAARPRRQSATMPICARRRASAGGRGHVRGQRRRAGGQRAARRNRPRPRQWIGASLSSGAVRSSPSAAPSAAS